MADQDSKDPKLNVPPPPEPEVKVPPKEEVKPDANVVDSVDTVVKQLDGPLEVEEMNESKELRERRESMRKRVQESVVNATDEPKEALLTAQGDGFSDLLKEANLSPRHIRFCCSAILGVAVLAGLILLLVNFIQNRPVRIPDPIEEPTQEDPAYEDAEDSSVLSSFLVGSDKGELDVATIINEEIGTEPEITLGFAGYLTDFKRMYETMQVNVPQLLDQSRDRTSTLDGYIQQLKIYIFMAEQNLQEMGAEDARLVDEYNAIEREKNQAEAQFFATIQELDAARTDSALRVFTQHAQALVAVRAQHQAYQKLIGYTQNLLPAMELRLQALELNREPLIKGVQVVHIDGVDLDLIIDENDL